MPSLIKRRQERVARAEPDRSVGVLDALFRSAQKIVCLAKDLIASHETGTESKGLFQLGDRLFEAFLDNKHNRP